MARQSGSLLAGKTTIVAGACGLLGAAVCRGIVNAGGRVVVGDVDIARAQDLAAELLVVAADAAVAAEFDVTDINSIRSVLSGLGSGRKPDGYVNCSYPRSARYGRPLQEVTYADFSENVSMHLGGCFLTTREFALAMAPSGSGTIVNIGSIYGAIAPRFEIYEGQEFTMPVEYAAIKAGVAHLSRYMAQFFKDAGVRVNVVSPGGVLNGQPASFLDKYGAYCGPKGMLDSEDVVGPILFLLSNNASHITGQNIIVDDGFSL